MGFGWNKKIARAIGRAESSVSEVINGRRRDRQIEVAVARRLRMKVDDAFPPKDDEAAA